MPTYQALRLWLRGAQLGATVCGTFTSPATCGNSAQGSTRSNAGGGPPEIAESAAL